MSGIISIVTNFAVNANIPIDSRIVASNSTARDAIQWRYDGLKVYVLDEKQSYIWEDQTWRVEYNGIYGGSGSLPGNVNVNFGNVPTTVGSSSNDFIYQATVAGATPDTVYLNNEFIRHTGIGSAQGWLGVEFKQQFKYLDNGTTNYSSAYISYNPVGNVKGGIAFGTGDGSNNAVTERMRINGDGNVGIDSTEPLGILQIGPEITNYGNTGRPLVFHRGDGRPKFTIGYNWKPTGDTFIDITHGISKIIQEDGNLEIQTRRPGGNYLSMFYISSLGGIGIKNTNPQFSLDVVGEIKTDDNVLSPKYTILGLWSQETSIYSGVGSGFVPYLGFKYLNEDVLVIREESGIKKFISNKETTIKENLIPQKDIAFFQSTTSNN